MTGDETQIEKRKVSCYFEGTGRVVDDKLSPGIAMFVAWDDDGVPEIGWGKRRGEEDVFCKGCTTVNFQAEGNTKWLV